jgi:acetamidase/formamidase
VETAAPGDTLVVHLTRVRLNRDWALSDDSLVGRAMDSDLAVKMKDAGKSVRWHLDLQRGVATPEKPSEHLTHYSVPLKPMLGRVGVAQNTASASPGTGDSGNYGGNMDFNEIVEGAPQSIFRLAFRARSSMSVTATLRKATVNLPALPWKPPWMWNSQWT